MDQTLSLAEAAARANVSKPTVRARLKREGHDLDAFRQTDGSLAIPVSALLGAGLTLHGPKGEGSGERSPASPGDGGNVETVSVRELTIRLDAAQQLAAERLERVRHLERELDRRHDELGALRLELTGLRELLTAPKALPAGGGWRPRRWGKREG